MVRRRSKFDSWWEHHPKFCITGTCIKLGSFGDFGDFGNTTGGLVKRDHASMAWMNQGFDSLILHQVVPIGTANKNLIFTIYTQLKYGNAMHVLRQITNY